MECGKWDDIILNGVSMHDEMIRDAMATELEPIENEAFDTISFLFDVWLDTPDAMGDWWSWYPPYGSVTEEQLKLIKEFWQKHGITPVYPEGEEFIIDGTPIGHIMQKRIEEEMSLIEKDAFECIPFVLDILVEGDMDIENWWEYIPEDGVLSPEQIERLRNFRAKHKLD